MRTGARTLVGTLLAALALALAWCCLRDEIDDWSTPRSFPPLRRVDVRAALAGLEGDDLAGLAEALARQAPRLEIGPESLPCGAGHLPRSILRESHRRLRELLEARPAADELAGALAERFEALQLAGRTGRGDVLFTGYYVPELEARRRPDTTFRWPLYRRPPDLERARLDAFGGIFRGRTLWYRRSSSGLVPYDSRAEIDAGSLAGRGLEIAWVEDRIGLFFLMIQGSGRLRFGDGTTRFANYAAQNGHPYVAIGRALVEEGLIPRERISMQSIRAYLEAHPEEVERRLASNPSYIFFALEDRGPFGASGALLTPGRSIAMDGRLVPQGALIAGRVPRLVPPAAADAPPRVAEHQTRLLVVQDQGGAIRGPGRVDLFTGAGSRAAWLAGHLRHEGELFLLLPRPTADQDDPAALCLSDEDGAS